MGDTVLLTYLTNEVKGNFNGFNSRPKRRLWERKKLYYFFDNTNLPIRQKEYFMQWSRFKISNLKRYDENYVLKNNN